MCVHRIHCLLLHSNAHSACTGKVISLLPWWRLRAFRSGAARAARAAQLFMEILQQQFIVYSQVPRLTSTLRLTEACAWPHEFVHVVNINHVFPSGSWIVWVLFYLCTLEWSWCTSICLDCQYPRLVTRCTSPHFRGNNHISSNIHEFGGVHIRPVGSHTAMALPRCLRLHHNSDLSAGPPLGSFRQPWDWSIQ